MSNKIIDSGEYLGIKWEIAPARSDFYFNGRENDVFCRIYSNMYLPNSKFGFNETLNRLYSVQNKDSDLKKIIFDEIDRIYAQILLQYELGGLKYLESQKKIAQMSN